MVSVWVHGSWSFGSWLLEFSHPQVTRASSNFAPLQIEEPDEEDAEVEDGDGDEGGKMAAEEQNHGVKKKSDGGGDDGFSEVSPCACKRKNSGDQPLWGSRSNLVTRMISELEESRNIPFGSRPVGSNVRQRAGF